MKVFVYFNLNKLCLSVRAVGGPHAGLVVAHARAVQLDRATFKVSQAGRARVLRERSKNVHAGIVGDLQGIDVIQWLKAGCRVPAMGQIRRVLADGLAELGLSGEPPDPILRATYDPYRFDAFVGRLDFAPLHGANRVDVVGADIRCAGVCLSPNGQGEASVGTRRAKPVTRPVVPNLSFPATPPFPSDAFHVSMHAASGAHSN